MKTKIFPNRKTVVRSLENPEVPLDQAWDYLESPSRVSPVIVNAKSILGIPEVKNGLELSAQKVGSVSFNVYKRDGQYGRVVDWDHPSQYLIKYQPNRNQTAVVFKSALQMCAKAYGNGYAYIWRAENGDPVELTLLDPEHVTPVYENGDSAVPELAYAFWPDPNYPPSRLLRENVIHIQGPSYNGLEGYPLWELVAGVLGLGQTLIHFQSTYFTNSARPGVVIELPAHVRDPEKIERFRRTWGDVHTGIDNSHKPALMEAGSKLTTLPAADLTGLAELSDRQIRAVANILNIPPSYLGYTDSYTSHNSLQEQQKQFLSHHLQFWLLQMEAEFTSKLLRESEKLSGSHYIEANRHELYETDEQTRETILTSQVNNGFRSIEEYRAAQNMPAFTPEERSKLTWQRQAGIQTLDPLTWQPLVAAAGPAPEDDPEVTDDPEKPADEQPEADAEATDETTAEENEAQPE